MVYVVDRSPFPKVPFNVSRLYSVVSICGWVVVEDIAFAVPFTICTRCLGESVQLRRVVAREASSKSSRSILVATCCVD